MTELANPDNPEITQWLRRWQDGEPAAMDGLLPLVYDQLRAIARSELKRQPDHLTLQATALVHEVLLRLWPQPSGISNRVHLFATAAKAMRHVLVDRARAKDRHKREGSMQRVDLIEAIGLPISVDENIEALDEALTALQIKDAAAAELLELRFFVGLTMSEIASVQNRDERTVYRDFAFAKAWLAARMAD
jgi:RNA polymerase sigma factor (TIGR02999 family)